MAAVALLKFYQATPTPITGDGEALKVVASNVVQITNSDDTDVKTWSLELLYAPPDSTHGPVNPGSPVLLDSGTDAAFLDFNFTPDVPGCYRFRLTVADTGSIENIDIRCIAVPLPNGFLIPPYERDPLPLESTEKPNELNFGGQPWGWAGDDEDTDHLMGNALVRRVDEIGTIESNLAAHTSNTSNPHQTNIANLGNGTLSELNGAITDAVLDDENDPRPPDDHASDHVTGGGDVISEATASSSGLLPAVSATPGAIAYSSGSGLAFALDLRRVVSGGPALEIGAVGDISTEGGIRFASDNASLFARNYADSGNVAMLQKVDATDVIQIGDGPVAIWRVGDYSVDLYGASSHPDAPDAGRIEVYSLDSAKELWVVDSDGDRTQLV